MSKMANKSLIGAFVIGAIALAVISVIIFGSGKFFKRQLEFITFFQGSIKGLSIGSPVTFRGVKIGEVKNIHIQARPSDLSFSNPRPFGDRSFDNRVGRARCKDWCKAL